MTPLEHPDVHHLRAAQGWLELGNHLEADKELERITPQLRAHPDVLDRAITLAGYENSDAAKQTKTALLRNLDIAEKLGCLDDAGLAEMRRGKAATVMKGPYKGDELSVDHIIPRAVCPELDNVIANLELMPLRMTESKNDKAGARQTDLARKFNKAGLLSDKGLKAVESAAK